MTSSPIDMNQVCVYKIVPHDSMYSGYTPSLFRSVVNIVRTHDTRITRIQHHTQSSAHRLYSNLFFEI